MTWGTAPSAIGTLLHTVTGQVLSPSLAGYSIGDWIFYATGEGLGSDILSTFPGWTLLTPDSGCKQIKLFSIIATSLSMTIPTVQWNNGASAQFWAGCFSFPGGPATTSGAVDVSTDRPNTSISTIGPVLSSILPTQNLELGFHVATKNKTSATNGATVTPSSGFTSIWSSSDMVQNGSNAIGYVGYWAQTTATALGTGGATMSVTENSASQGAKLALIPGPSSYIPYPPTSLGGMNVQVCQ